MNVAKPLSAPAAWLHGTPIANLQIPAANVQQHARLRQMILETFDDMSEFEYDVVYEDIVECMEYETNVKQFFYFQSLLHSVAMRYKAKANPSPLFIRSLEVYFKNKVSFFSDCKYI